MGFLRKSTFLATGGLSGLGMKANSKKERTAKALEKQNRMMKEQMRQQKRHAAHVTRPTPKRTSNPTVQRATVAVSPSPTVESTRDCPWCAETIKAAAVLCRYCNRDVVPSQYDHLQETHPQSFELVWPEAKSIKPWPTHAIPKLLAACQEVEAGELPADAVKKAFAAPKPHYGP